MASQGPYYRFIRWLLRHRFRQYTCHYAQQIEPPVVYICRHRNTVGPISTLCLLPVGPRPWVLSVFTDNAACAMQLGEYTYPVTWRIKPRLAHFLGKISGRPFAALVRSAGGIPVYRQSLKVRDTFHQSLDVLERGESIIIYPDVNYAEQNADRAMLYDGFLTLEYMWNRRTGGHIRFVPVNISASNARMDVGETISFTGDKPYKDEKAEIIDRLEIALDTMARDYGV